MNELRCLACFSELQGEKYCPVCGSAEIAKPKDPYHLVPGTLVHNRYLIGLALGAGGFSIVYKAWDTNLKRIVAVKEFFPSGTVNRIPGKKELLLPTGDRKAMYYSELNRFIQEAKAMAKFSNNKSIVHVLDFFEENDAAYIVMEYLEGIDLKDYLKQRGAPLTWEETAYIMFPIMDAVKDIHAAGMLHRDIAPDNIRITADNKIKLMDFGAVRLSDKDNYESPNPIIKIGYAPIEQYTTGAKQGVFTDVYALGATLYEMLTGIRPDESKDREQEDTLARPSDLGIALPDYVERAIMLALAIDKDIRFKSIDLLEASLKGERSVLYPEQAFKRRKRNRILSFAGIAVAAVLVFVAGGYYYNNYLKAPKATDHITKDAVLSVWLSLPEDADVEQAESAVEQLKNGFAQFVSSQGLDRTISADMLLVPEAEYGETLAAERPSVFAAPDYSSQTAQWAADISWMYRLLDKKTFILYDHAQASFPSNKFAPICFDIGTIYYNNKAFATSGAKIPNKTNSTLDLMNSVPGAMAVSPNCLALISESYGAALSETEKGLAILEPLLKDGKRFEDFRSGDAVAYIGRLTEMRKVQSALPGYAEEVNIPTGSIVGIYGTTLCVSADLLENENDLYAAMLFLSYLYSPEAQRLLFVNNALPGIPVNLAMLEVYQTYHRGTAELLQDIPKNLIMLGENNRVSLAAEKKLAALLESGAYTRETALNELK